MKVLVASCLVALLAPVAGWAQAITANETVVHAGSTVSADWTADPGHSPSDWISFYHVNDSNTSYGQHGTPSFVNTGAPLSGTVEFGIYPSTPAGTYEFRYLLNGGYVTGATSGAVTVLDRCDGTSIDVQVPSVAIAGTSVEVGWSLTGGLPSACAHASDWLAMWPQGAPDTASGYGNTVPGFVYMLAATSGTTPFTINASTTPGVYEFRYIRYAGTSSSAISGAITVLDDCTNTTYELSVTPARILSGQDVTVGWNVTTDQPASCASASDWIAFYRYGAANTAYGNSSPAYIFTGGVLSGEQTFTAVSAEPGVYEFRYLRSSGYDSVAAGPVTVMSAAVPALEGWGLGGVVALLLVSGGFWSFDRGRRSGGS